MSTSADGIEVIDQTAEHRFVVRGSGGAAELEYRLDGDRFYLIHTEVPDAWEGHGVGSQLVRAALRRAEAEHLTVIPWCPFARRWLRGHEAEASAITIDWETPRPT